MSCSATARTAVGAATFFQLFKPVGIRRNHLFGDGSEITICVHASESCAQATDARTAPRLRGKKGMVEMIEAANWIARPWTMKTLRPRKRAAKPPFACKWRRVARKEEVRKGCLRRTTSGSLLIVASVSGSVSLVGMGSKRMASCGDSIMRRVGMMRPKVYSICCFMLEMESFDDENEVAYHKLDEEENEHCDGQHRDSPSWHLVCWILLIRISTCEVIHATTGDRHNRLRHCGVHPHDGRF